MRTLGQHTLIDFYDGDPQILGNPDCIREILLSAIRLSGLTIVLDTFHHFKPNGVSGVVVIAESHVTIHTWPEHGYAAVDVFTCGESLQGDVIQSAIQEGIKSTRVTTKVQLRGCLPNGFCRCEDEGLKGLPRPICVQHPSPLSELLPTAQERTVK